MWSGYVGVVMVKWVCGSGGVDIPLLCVLLCVTLCYSVLLFVSLWLLWYSKKPHSELRSEIVSLKNIIDQYKRSLQSLDNEIELHKQSKETHRKEINAEKQ